MKNRFFALVCATVWACGLVGLPACKPEQKVAGPKAVPATLFTVGGKPVPVDEFKYIYEKNNANDSQAYTDKNVRDYLNLFVNFKLKVAEAQALGMDTTKEFLGEYNDYKKQLARPYLTENSLADKMVQEAYERLGEEVKAAHILVMLSPEAEPADTLRAYEKITGLRQQAVDGADFTALALRYSEDPSVKDNQGDLGYFTALQMIYPFENMAYATKVGEVSPVVRTQFGYHIIKVNQRRPTNGSVRVAHIMARFGSTEKPTREDTLAARQKINEIEKQIKAGANWDSLCNRYSDDANTKANGGELQSFSAGNMIPAFAEASFNLANPGQVSPPVMTPFGWHLIKLLERKPLAPFDELAPILKQKVTKDSRAEINRVALLLKLRQDNGFVETADKNLIYTKVDSTLLKGLWSYNRADNDLSLTVFTLRDKKYTLRDVLSYIENNQGSLMNAVLKPYTTSLYTQYVDQCVLEYEERNLPARYPEYGHLVNEYREGILLFKIMEEKVWTKAIADKEGLEKYFEQYREKYRWNDRVKATIYTVASNEALANLKEGLKKELYENEAVLFDEARFVLGRTAPDSTQLPVIDRLANYIKADSNVVVELRGFYVKGEKPELAKSRIDQVKAQLAQKGVAPHRVAEKLLGEQQLPADELINYKGGGVRYGIFSKAKKVLVQSLNRTNPLAVELTEGMFQKGDQPAVDAVTWQPGSYDVTVGGKISHVVIAAVEPARPKRLDETRGLVVSDYQNQLEQQWLQELKAKYPVSLNEEEVKKMIKK
jgi:peptidyl-prolyl cis-trans isomerase SurA